MEKIRCWRVLAFFFLMVILVSQAEGRVIRTVTGEVRGRNGNPKAYARVQLTGPGRYAALTNTQGRFIIPNVIPGTYNITVWEGNRFQEFSRTVKTGNLPLRVNW